MKKHRNSIEDLKVAICQIRSVVGDIRGNANYIETFARAAADQGAQLIVFPELALVGYPPKDLLDSPEFVASIRPALDKLISKLPPEATTLVGFVEYDPGPGRPDLYNSVAVVRNNKLVDVARKQLLPTYDVFDEARYFAPGDYSCAFSCGSEEILVGLTICEDAWNDPNVPKALRVDRYDQFPFVELAPIGVDLIVNVAASPYRQGKPLARSTLFRTLAVKYQTPIVVVNQVGANDELIFDGNSAVIADDGGIVVQAPAFQERMLVTSIKTTERAPEQEFQQYSELLEALVLGVRDYVHGTGHGSTGVVLGLSGGIDSALVAAIAARAVGPQNVSALFMPTVYTSKESIRDAAEVAKNLDIDFRVVDIDGLVRRIAASVPETDKTAGNWFQNAQARLRALLLMAESNLSGKLLLATGNKSEIATGYCTLYGDTCGAIAPIADVYKTEVFRLAQEFNRQEELRATVSMTAGDPVIPLSIIEKAPSAELDFNQTDQDSLPPYDLLDAVLLLLIEEQKTTAEIEELGFDSALVRKVKNLVRASEHKRRQLPPGLIVSKKAFGFGRRYPVRARYGA